MSEDVLQFNPKLLDNIPNVMPSISESIQDPSTENIIQTNDTQQSVEQSHHQIQGSNETILRANEALLALSAADPLAIQHLLQSNDLQLHQQARIHYIQTHPFLQIYYLTFVKYLSSCVIALQALHSEFIQDTRSSQPEDVMAMLDSLATYSGFAGVGLVTYVGMYLCSLHGDAERKYTIDQVMHVFPTISSHRFIDLLAQDLTIENEKEIHALAREAKNSSLNKPNIILRWINKAEGLLTWIQEGFSSVTGGYLVGGNGNSSTANELIESFALVHAGKVLDGIFRYRKHSCHESHQKQILHRLNIYPLEENKLWILKCLALDLDILTYHPNNDQDSTGDSSPAVDPTANSPSKRRPLPPIPPPRTSSALSEKSNLEFGKQEAQHLDEMLQKVNQLQDQLNKQNEANVPERNIYSEVDELHRQLSQLTKKLQQLQEQDSSEQDVDQDIDVGNGYGQKKMQRNTMSKASSQASSNKSSSHTTEGAQTSTALLEQVVIELTLQVRLLQEDVSQLSQTPSRESLPLHYVNTPPIKPKRENTPHPRIDDGDNVKSAHGQLESSNSEHAACCIIM